MNHDRALGLVRDAGGDELARRLEHLEQLSPIRREPTNVLPPDPSDALDADVVILGGGLWSIFAPVLAARGLSVVVMDRATIGQTHREWNASERELEALIDVGLLDRATLERCIVARYERGVCRFHGGDAHEVVGVLDRAVDAQTLLDAARARGKGLGVRYLDGHTVLGHASRGDRVRVLAQAEGAKVELTARLLVDARGAASPHATADLVCPTVGGVVEGLSEGDGPTLVDPRVGDILATTEGIEDGRQHVWEAFPGRPGQVTVYLFYYARADARGSLLDLYARFFDTLPRYKHGDARLVRPTFGLIPGWSRLSPAPSAPPGRIVLVGDAAARHSPLTYCGFGATLRSLHPAAEAILARIEGASPRAHVVHDTSTHALTGALAHLMASGAFAGDELNALLDAAFRTLAEMGNDRYAALLRDEMTAPDFVAFLRRTASRHPAVWSKVLRGLGPITATRWGMSVARTMLRAPHPAGP